MMMPDPVFPGCYFQAFLGDRWREREKERRKGDWSGKRRCGKLWQGCPISVEVWFTETKLIKGGRRMRFHLSTCRTRVTHARERPTVSTTASITWRRKYQQQLTTATNRPDVFHAQSAYEIKSLDSLNLFVNYLNWPRPSGMFPRAFHIKNHIISTSLYSKPVWLSLIFVLIAALRVITMNGD